MEERLIKGTKVRDKFEDQKEYVIEQVREFEEDTFGQGKFIYGMKGFDGDKEIWLYRSEFDIIERPVIENTIVVSAFPCCGKTYAYQHQDDISVLDSDSSEFSWVKNGFGRNTDERHPDFPNNYIQHIKNNIGKVHIIFVSSHLQVRQALTEAGIKFITVYPKQNMLHEWVGRMYCRGNNDKFIKFQIDHWDEFVKNVESEPHGSELLRLGSNEYIDLSALQYAWNKTNV